jgi:hypothetical protein
MTGQFNVKSDKWSTGRYFPWVGGQGPEISDKTYKGQSYNPHKQWTLSWKMISCCYAQHAVPNDRKISALEVDSL